MNRVDLQRKLYDSRNAYLKHKAEMTFHANEIKFLNRCIDSLNAPTEDPLDFETLFV